MEPRFLRRQTVLFSPKQRDRKEPIASPGAEPIRSATDQPAARTFGLRWPIFSTLQWSGLAGATAVAVLVTIIGVQQWRGSIQPVAPIQVAMATISDRSALFESSDVRMRGTQQPIGAEQRFRDVEMPTEVLKRVIASATKGASGTVTSESLPFLEGSKASSAAPTRIIVDPALASKLDIGTGRDHAVVRVYDLQDPRVADVRSALGPLPATDRFYFLTFKP
jgi:hypothetical protein